MNVENSSPQHNIAMHLHQNGYVTLTKWLSDQTTIDIGRSIGNVVNVQALLPGSGIPTVQTLSPRLTSESSSNRYSGTYGINDFPLHTDLAHWVQPPRYLILRCRSGSAIVTTKLLRSSALASTLGTATLRRAWVRPRHPSRNGKQCLLPLMFSRGNTCGFRWDPLFLIPMNGASRQVADVMSVKDWKEANSVTLALTSPGDTLIIDNWCFLHGRSNVPITELGRRIERVYLSELYT